MTSRPARETECACSSLYDLGRETVSSPFSRLASPACPDLCCAWARSIARQSTRCAHDESWMSR
eukprot:scaffold200691_cov33-Tisochrysis_lutea.AAC.7